MFTNMNSPVITRSEWLIFPKPNPQAKLRLFCFPYAGGGASVFRSWSDHLPAQVEICAVQLPGRENRLKDMPFTRLAPLAQAIAAELPLYLDRPFALFGHSLGAAIAFEVASLLRQREGVLPVCLFASGRVAPHLPDPEMIHHLPDNLFIDRLRDYNGTPEDILQNDELMHFLLPMLRADFEVNETYISTQSKLLDCPIYAFRGSQDDIMTFEEVAAWGEQTNDSFTLRTIPGDHFFIHSAQDLFLQILAYDIRKLLSKLP